MSLPLRPRSTTDAPTRLPDRIGRGLLAFDVASTLFAFVAAVTTFSSIPADQLVTYTWRTVGYLVFAGLWALLAIWPRSLPGVWELTILHKAVVSVLFFAYGDAPEARTTALIDSTVCAATVAAYLLCRGWLAWRNVAAAPARDRRP